MSQQNGQAPAPPRSSVLAADEVASLERAYPVGEWLRWRRTDQGSANVSFYVTTSRGEYVLRRSNSRKTESSADFEIRLLQYLRDRAYPAPRVVETRSGDGYYRNGKFYLLTELIRGGTYSPDNPAHLMEAAAALARYHRLVVDFPEPYMVPSAVPRIGSDGLQALDGVLGLGGEILPHEAKARLDAALAVMRPRFVRVAAEAAAVYPRLPRLLIHGSLGRSAIIFNRNRIAGVVDYERAHLEARALDLAYTVKAFARASSPIGPHYRIGFDLPRCRLFMDAYQEVEPLPGEEMGAMSLIFRMQRLAKVMNKAENLLRKHEAIPQQEKDVHKVTTMLETEERRLEWLERHEDSLLHALGANRIAGVTRL